MVAAGLAVAGPVEGPVRTSVKLDPGAAAKVALEFKGGERACVILVGDHDPVMDLSISVYDANKRLVTKCDRGGDFCCVVWHPAVTAKYHVEIQSKGRVWNKVYLVIK
jgi:hypothetical protein